MKSIWKIIISSLIIFTVFIAFMCGALWFPELARMDFAWGLIMGASVFMLREGLDELGQIK